MFLNTNGIKECNTNGVNPTKCNSTVNGNIDTHVVNVDLLSRFYLPICSREIKVRKAALKEIECCVEQWLDGSTPLCLMKNGSAAANVTYGTQNNIALHVSTLLRLSVSCPFADVRVKCSQILQAISDRGVLVPFDKVAQGPSNYIPPDENIYDKMTGEVINELRDPTWILDRRNSGKLFWRRDSVSERNRVKFRCDVEVVEYLRIEPEPTVEDWSSDEEDERYGWRLRPWDQEIPPPNTFWGGVCVLVIAAVITYQWLSV